jgi:hypothetical protein
MRLRVAAWVATTALLTVGCTPRKVRLARKLEGQYSTGTPDPTTWLWVDPGGADRAWYNGHLRASIYTDSNCGARFLDGHPQLLLRHLMYGLDEVELLRDEPTEVAGRTGRLCVQKGTLDGVWVQVGAIVFNRGACTYDMVYISSPEHFDEGWPSFEGVVVGFEATGETE